MPPSVLVIGYGNTLRGDDGLGPAVVEALANRVDPRQVTLLAVATLTPELAIAVAEARRVIFVDAAVVGPVDQVICRPISQRPSGDAVWGHQLDATALVNLARSLYGHAAESYLVSFRGQSFELREGLTPAVHDAVERVAACVLQQILRGEFRDR